MRCDVAASPSIRAALAAAAMSQSHSRSSSHVRLHVNADDMKQDEGQWQPANAKAAVELPSLSLASHGALLPGTGPDSISHVPERQLAPSPLWGEHADAKAASATATSAAAADQQTLRSRHGRSQPDPAASAASDCFAADFLEQPLLQNRGASSVTAQHLLGTPPPRLHLRWDNITQYVSAPTAADPSARKRILCNVSGRAYSGETLAVMGPSGSGKTSLISLLAGGWRKARAAGNLDGSILINGQPSTKRMKRYIAYVAQDDLLFANLTVEQTLRYSALLNLPRELSYEQKLQRVRSVIELLGLSKCSHTKIGGAFSRGISGGERKRTSVANEMLANPSLIMADEPTSGLDSTTAARLISTFRSLARGGRAVVCSIHQPSSQIFDLFDKVLLLAQGRTIYYGSSATVVRYFASTGLMCKPYYNPSDFMLELVSDLTHEGIAREEKLEEQRNAAVARDGTGTGTALASYPSSHLNGSSNGAELAKDAANAEKGVATMLLADHLPGRSYDVEAAGSEANAERTIRRLPVLWARIGAHVFEIEDAARTRQIAELEQQSATTADADAATGADAAGGAPRVLALTLTAEEKALADASLDAEGDQSSRWPLSWWEQFTLLLSRSFLQHKGERITALYAAQVLGIAIVVGLVWFQTPRRVDTLIEQTGALFFISMFWSFTPLFNSLTTFPAERAIIIKERASGSYRLSAYFLSKVVAEAPVELAYPVFFMLITYFMVSFHTSAGGFFFTVLTILLSTLCAQSYGLLISCTLLDFKQSITFASVSMLTLMLLSGFYVKLESIPVWLRWATYLVFPKYTYGILGYIQFHDFDFPCGNAKDQPTGVTFSSCPASGREVMSQFNFDVLPLWANIVILASMTIVFRVVAYLALRKTTQP